MWENVGDMPKRLKFLTAQAAFCVVFLAISVFPNDSFSIQGRHAGYAEWWSSGAGVFASLVGLVGPFVAWALVSKKSYARSAYVAFLVLAFVVPNLFLGMLAYVLPGLLVVGAGAFYMYKWQGVQAYFAPSPSIKRTR